jgi:hypothetical protein
VYRALLIGPALLVLVGLTLAEDTPKAAQTRKLLKQKVTVDYKDDRLQDVVDDLEEKVKGLKIRLDTKGGVSKNRKLTYKAKDKPVEQVLNEMFMKEELGYVIISQVQNAYDGGVLIKVGKERGDAQGK